MSKKAVIFDLDGVIVSTDEYHYRAWKRLCEEEGIPFSREINERLRGVSRMESLDLILKGAAQVYSPEAKEELAARKNRYYVQLLQLLTPADILPGVTALLQELKDRGVGCAIGSSSKNTPFILEKIGLGGFFDAVADGNQIRRSKPDPEVFLLAAEKLGLRAEQCVVVEDAEAGIEAALAAGMKAAAVSAAANYPGAHVRGADLREIGVGQLLQD
ncbi:beta-phosphoglucomutase [Paenibacillus mucilaginosus]|uniref:Beta-phosphoglucomutase n=1 Tax=Paenibacillus mucilaginosus (strain KNP414) TaxID=1036673 RepID=F8F4U1_PAEMK|nr:beta-phosphoglucomutase [Paenibacillus mucilaginosus]AEI40671.1 Beta-phosphoglucomutase [Paenibacillus mucilaginosus KNP414]MCG7211841.1 beta-phosphoglucomutase [Paenibacillus mucilaginosus]WDM29810.1 beta-phosphoglucomutase [Paenibacillus mucilaginosus]